MAALPSREPCSWCRCPGTSLAPRRGRGSRHCTPVGEQPAASVPWLSKQPALRASRQPHLDRCPKRTAAAAYVLDAPMAPLHSTAQHSARSAAQRSAHQYLLELTAVALQGATAAAACEGQAAVYTGRRGMAPMLPHACAGPTLPRSSPHRLLPHSLQASSLAWYTVSGLAQAWSSTQNFSPPAVASQSGNEGGQSSSQMGAGGSLPGILALRPSVAACHVWQAPPSSRRPRKHARQLASQARDIGSQLARQGKRPPRLWLALPCT